MSEIQYLVWLTKDIIYTSLYLYLSIYLSISISISIYVYTYMYQIWENTQSLLLLFESIKVFPSVRIFS